MARPEMWVSELMGPLIPWGPEISPPAYVSSSQQLPGPVYIGLVLRPVREVGSPRVSGCKPQYTHLTVHPSTL